MIGNGSGEGAADDAAEQGAASGPSGAGGVEVKQPAQITYRAADDDIVVPEKEAAQGRDAGRDEERSARRGLG